MKKILVIDAQGGGLGKQIVAKIKENIDGVKLIAVGTNSIASSGMLKAGADAAATGENSVVVCARDADFIVGPIGIVVADSMLGEITPKMAVAVGQSPAKKLLIPWGKCDNQIVGSTKVNMKAMIDELIVELKEELQQ